MCSPARLMTKGFLAFLVLGIFWHFRIHSECFKLAKQGKFRSPEFQFRDSTISQISTVHEKNERKMSVTLAWCFMQHWSGVSRVSETSKVMCVCLDLMIK